MTFVAGVVVGGIVSAWAVAKARQIHPPTVPLSAEERARAVERLFLVRGDWSRN